MENPGKKILSFEEFMQQGSMNEPTDMTMDMPAEVPAEIPAEDGDPAGDMPILSDVELVDGGSVDLPAEIPAEGENGEESNKEESEEDAQ
jgi:hypothetical protein